MSVLVLLLALRYSFLVLLSPFLEIPRTITFIPTSSDMCYLPILHPFMVSVVEGGIWATGQDY